MAAITGSIEIARSADEVFAYSTDIERRTEWQPTVRDIKAETADPIQTGSRIRETRLVTGGPRTFGWEITTYDSPRSWSFRGTDGLVRPYGTMHFTPTDDGARTKVDFEIDFRGRGPAAVLAMLARRDARTQVPRELEQLRQRLEQR